MLQFPDDVRNINDPIVQELPDSLIERRVIEPAGGMDDGRIGRQFRRWTGLAVAKIQSGIINRVAPRLFMHASAQCDNGDGLIGKQAHRKTRHTRGARWNLAGNIRVSQRDLRHVADGPPQELLCEDHVGTYVIPFPCQWRDGNWQSVETNDRIVATVVGWRPLSNNQR